MQKSVLRASAALLALTVVTPVNAQEAKTFAESFAVPVFETIDENGVNLVTGTWRVRTPVIWLGEGEFRQERGLEWTGRAWTHVDQPSLWRDDGKYIVMYKGASHEFNGFGSGFSKRAPIDGSSLSCDTLQGESGISYCRFTARNGDFVVFQGFYSSLSNFGPDMGFSSLEFGNVGIQEVLVSEVALGSPQIYRSQNGSYFGGNLTLGYQVIAYGSQRSDQLYDAVNYSLRMGDQRLLINTPNNGDSDEHYLRPISTTQTITDDFGQAWSYQFNSDRELVRVSQPGGAAAITATYHSDHKIKTITTPAGTWTYSYTTPGDYGTTTVVNPKGETTYVKYHRDHGYVTEARDALNRLTTYNWNGTTRRLTSMSLPEGNSVTFGYDDRGNVVQKTEIAKGGNLYAIWQAAYAPSCDTSNQANCNQPRWVIDANGHRTDYGYTGNSPGPTTVELPPATPGAPRSTTFNTYVGGRLETSRTCTSSATCGGSPDEIISTFGYSFAGFENSYRHSGYIKGVTRALREERVTANGLTLVTCHQFDTKNNRIGSTPPNAQLTSCPTGQVSPVAVSANPPESAARSTPVFADGTSGGGGGGYEPPYEDPCITNGTICP